MSSATARRPYRKRRRAEQEQATRERIVAAALALHATVGPARTTISAIAERAGVQRLTVYRHFPDQRALFAACSQHFFAANPPPDTAAWAAIADPAARLATALAELYAWHERTEAMLTSVTRDAEVLPGLVGSGYASLLQTMRASLLAGWPAGPGGRLVAGAIGHALHFRTWLSLVRVQGLTTAEAVTLMTVFVQQAAAGRAFPPAPS
jgi:AcrR family transcriptional regulator